MLKKITVLILFVLCFQCCNLNTSGTFINKDIDRRKKEEMSVLRDKFLKAITDQDVVGIKALMSDSLKNRLEATKLINELAPMLGSYKIIDEYNIINATPGKTSSLTTNDKDVNAYELNYPALNKETYITILVPDKNTDLLILIAQDKYKEEWKVNDLVYGKFRVHGKTAPEYFELSKNSFEKSHLMNALNYVMLSDKLLNPLNDLFNYKKESEIKEFYRKVMDETKAKYPLPLTLDRIVTKPAIYQMTPQVTPDGFFPMIYYVSAIQINDESALRKENEEVKKEVNRIFSGITEDKKYIFYWVSNELPGNERIGEQYGFVDTLQMKGQEE